MNDRMEAIAIQDCNASIQRGNPDSTIGCFGNISNFMTWKPLCDGVMLDLFAIPASQTRANVLIGFEEILSEINGFAFKRLPQILIK